MSDWADLPTELLPPVLQDFVRLIGIAATMQLVEQYGGRRLYIPVNATPDHAIAQLIGVDKLAALGKVYGLQEHFYIPKATKALLVLRDAQIRADYASKSASQLAREYRIGERHIWRILAESPSVESGQAQLFS